MLTMEAYEGEFNKGLVVLKERDIPVTEDKWIIVMEAVDNYVRMIANMRDCSYYVGSLDMLFDRVTGVKVLIILIGKFIPLN